MSMATIDPALYFLVDDLGEDAATAISEIAGGRRSSAPASIRGVLLIGDSTTLGQGDFQTADYGLNAGAVFAEATIHTANSFLGTGVDRRAVQPYDVGGGPNMGSELSLARMLIANGVPAGLPMSKMGINGSTLPLWLNPTNLGHFGDYIAAQELATNVPITHILDGRGPNDASTDADSANAQPNYEALYSYVIGRFGNRFQWVIALLHPSTTSASITTARKNAFRAGQIAFAAAHPDNVETVEIGHALLGSDSIHPHADGHWSIGNTFGRAMVATLRTGSGLAPRLSLVLEPTRRSDAAGVDVTPTAPPTQAGQIQYLVTSTAGLDVAPSLTAANGFAEVLNGKSTANGVRCWLALYRRRVTQAALTAAGGVRLTDPIVNKSVGTQQRVSAFIFVVDGAAQDDAEINASHINANDANGTAVSVAGTTSTVDNCLALILTAAYSGTDSVASAYANGSLSSFTLVRDSHGPTQQKLTLAAGIKDTNGLITTTTGLRSVNTLMEHACVVIKP
jgi:hypothetical protein